MADLPTAEGRVLELLAGLPGVVAVAPVRREIVGQVVELEKRYEHGGLVPLNNLGVRIALKRRIAVALLKDKKFREPPEPTVYLVEEVQPVERGGRWCITVGAATYRVVGEEVLASRQPFKEKTISLGDSFVIFPDRRGSGTTPSYFLVPPLGFPELEEVQEGLGIDEVLSISPSAQADNYLREACGFSHDPSLATLLLAFNPVEQPTAKP